MLSDYTTAVADLVRDKDQVMTGPQSTAAIDAAVLRYSLDRPRVVVEDVTSPGGYRLPLPVAWVSEISRLASVEYPIGDVPASLLDITRVGMYRSPSAELIEIPVPLESDEDVRLTYSGRHSVTALVDTIPLDHRLLVCYWAASIICDQFASYYAGDGEPTFNADAVNHQNKSQTWASRAREYRKQYTSTLGVAEKTATSASAVVNWDNTDSRGQPRIFPRLPR